MGVKPAGYVTWNKALLLSGPQKRLPQSLLFIISAEESLLKREKSEASGVTWRDVGGVKGGPSLEVGGSDT